MLPGGASAKGAEHPAPRARSRAAPTGVKSETRIAPSQPARQRPRRSRTLTPAGPGQARPAAMQPQG